MNNFTADDLHQYLTPSKCERRPFLQASGLPEAPPDEFAQLLMRLGKTHEATHLNSLGRYYDCRAIGNEERLKKTQIGIQAREPVIYQPYFLAEHVSALDGCSVSGICDFMILYPEGYALRDAKLTKNIDQREHPEIFAQMSLYGWLFEQMFGEPPHRLEILNGMNDIVPIEYDKGVVAMDYLKEILILRTTKEEPYSPVGHSKCRPCSFYNHCWTIAEEQNETGLVYGLTLSMAKVLHSQGVSTINQLLNSFTANTLALIKIPHGKTQRKIGKSADIIISHARALATKSNITIGPLAIPYSQNYVMFDLEGLPPFSDHLDKVYLWGMQVYGEKAYPYRPALAGFGPQGDQEGWEQFLGIADDIMKQHDSISFIHWANYEKVKIELYQKRFGDPNGIGSRVLSQCVDLKEIVTAAMVLPTYGYGLKELEKRAGFVRSMDEYGGAWSIARYIEACETHDEALRTEVIEKIQKYNEEDLAATWSVMKWIQTINGR